MDRFRYTFQAMACENVIELFCDSLADADEAARLAVLEVARIEMKYSRYRDDSVVTVINRAAGHEPVSIDQETSQLLDYADVCYRQSDGLFDITSGVLRRVWTFKSGAMKSVPLPAELEPFLTLVDWSRVERQFFSDGAQIRLPLPGMQIDLVRNMRLIARRRCCWGRAFITRSSTWGAMLWSPGRRRMRNPGSWGFSIRETSEKLSQRYR
jgi:FAD:protein FMN transferase